MAVWFITGTTSGFGRRLVTSALQRGDRVIATGRSLEKLQVLEKACAPEFRENLRVLQLDVTEGLNSLRAKADEAVGMWGEIDVLVNNAGIGFPGLLEEGGSSLLRKQFETNVFGLLDVTTALLPHLRASKAATVVMVGSRSAWKPEIPGLGLYAASKAAVHTLSETLSVELEPFGIRVLLVAPGSFRTEGIYGQGYFTENPIPAYDSTREAAVRRFASIPGSEKGNPDKAMEVVVDVVRGEGVAQGRDWPLYLVLGEDAQRDVTTKCEKVLTIAEGWRDVACSVSFSE